MAVVMRMTSLLSAVRLEAACTGNGVPAPQNRNPTPPAAARPLLSVSKPSLIVRTESNVRKESIPKPDPPCVVCGGTGRVDCHNCNGRGRTNHIELMMLPKGEWPKWCRSCGGSGLGYCARCLGTGEYRYIMGFQFMKKDTDQSQDNQRYRHVRHQNGSHSFTELLLNDDQSDSGGKSFLTTSQSTREPLSVSLRNSLVIDTAEDQTSSEILSESVTRRLILLRHAKSSWQNRSLRDHDRPLSDSGRADAAKLSQKLEQLGWIPQLILCSDAQRTRETLKIMQEQVRAFLEAEVHFISSFYSVAAMDGQTAEHLQQTICKYSRNEILTIMCMGHNRGWEEAASMFSGASIELKTCNAALLEASGKSWEEAFSLAGLGGWKLHGIIKPDTDL